ncbi:hypothetical protein FHU10_0582 [Serratia fonticola]|jgi:hypothetical protein|uniref:Sel1 repeat n=1 Tax=Serratia fonticola TaxID=47917 RepID=A0A542D6B0_SERFO|nr:sel1 repeat family protein [Serratia fonticola]TQI79343.1 hypothetical protein FHU09_1868 [Serratia fonticola]TQI98632.1 hypothetical protein FHU11_4180 [Serratia fonticola]TVZ68160.1 hypothetical protein FHU10_0582 [Serratia fonticola]
MKKCTGMIISLILCAHAQAESFNPNTRYPAVSLLNITAPACTTYTPLPANSVPSAENAYQIANKIWGEKEVGLYTHMYQLGEQAAKAGHLQAMYLMAILYTRKKQNIGFYDYAEFKPEEALNYLNILMQKGYSDAFYLMAQIRNTSVIKTPTPASFFLNRAMELGSPDAWMSVAQYHIERRDTPKAKPFIQCAAQNGSGRALNMLALAKNLSANTPADWEQAFSYLWRSAKKGYRTSFEEFGRFNQDYQKQQGRPYLTQEFLRRVQRLQEGLQVGTYHEDPYRRAQGKNPQKKGNPRLEYPALEKVLPLPSVPLPAWNGDMTVVMSTQDARYYREDYTLTRLNDLLGRRNDAPGGKVIIFHCINNKECQPYR